MHTALTDMVLGWHAWLGEHAVLDDSAQQRGLCTLEDHGTGRGSDFDRKPRCRILWADFVAVSLSHQ